MINLKNFKDFNLFFVGIGGISMSALVHFCHKFGAKVRGSDISINEEIKNLNKFGIKTYIGHDENHITDDINLLVYSGAIKEDNPEVVRAKQLGIKCLERSEFLGIIMSMFLNSIVVAGTHGKTTTTAMLASIFRRTDIRPSVHLGGESVEFGNYLLGNKDLFITEGCEYRNSIRFLNPITTIITSIELDHTDYYHNYSEIENAFLNLANNTRQNVIVFDNINFSNKISSKVNVVNVGFGDNFDVCGKNLTQNNNGTYSFDVFYNGYIGKFTTPIVGFYNAKNALCAIATALIYDVPISDIYMAIKTFKGVRRRFEKVGDIGVNQVICDYAHHPTEILNSINTAKEIYGKITVVFQPHTYSRTIGLKNEFKKCFHMADNLIIFKTYPAREKYIVGGSAKELFNEIKHKNKHYCDTKKALKEALLTIPPNNLVLVLGAGDIYEITKKIVKSINKNKDG